LIRKSGGITNLKSLRESLGGQVEMSLDENKENDDLINFLESKLEEIEKKLADT
jgi:hypothetical protein